MRSWREVDQMRKYITASELLRILNEQLAKHDECGDCRFREPIWRLQEPDATGLNWNDELILNCSGRPIEPCAPIARRILTDAAARYSLRADEGWLDDLMFQYRGHVFRCVSASRGVASTPVTGPFARPSNAYWWVTIDDASEVQAFEASPDDVDEEDVRRRIIEWASQEGLV